MTAKNGHSDTPLDYLLRIEFWTTSFAGPFGYVAADSNNLVDHFGNVGRHSIVFELCHELKSLPGVDFVVPRVDENGNCSAVF